MIEFTADTPGVIGYLYRMGILRGLITATQKKEMRTEEKKP
jgi:hypothetical protein